MFRSAAKPVLIALLSFALIGAVYAATPPEAKAVTTNYLNKQVAWLKAQVASIKKTNTSQSTSISGLGSRMTKAEATGTALTGRVASLESSQSAMMGLFETLSGGSSTLLGRVSALETSKTAMSSAMTNLTSALAVLTGRMTAVETTHAALIARMTAAESAHTGLNSRVAALESAQNGGDFFPEKPLEVVVTTTTVRVSGPWPGNPTKPYTLENAPTLGLALYQQGAVESHQLQRYDIVRWNGVEVYRTGYGKQTDLNIPDGSTVEHEYWIEVFGQRVHGLRQLTVRVEPSGF